jgi:hypothetical protein
VSAAIRATSGGSPVSLNGQSALTVDIGTIKSGDVVVKEVTLSFSIADGLKITQNGIHLELSISSDEHTQAFSYDYKP